MLCVVWVPAVPRAKLEESMSWNLRKKPSGVTSVPRVPSVPKIKPVKPIEPIRPIKPIAPLGYEYYWKPGKK